MKAFRTAICPRCLNRWETGETLKSRGYVAKGGYGFTHRDCPTPAKRLATDPFPDWVKPSDLLPDNVPSDLEHYFPHHGPVGPSSRTGDDLIKCTECGQNHPRTYNCWDDYLSRGQ